LFYSGNRSLFDQEARANTLARCFILENLLPLVEGIISMSKRQWGVCLLGQWMTQLLASFF